MVLLLGIDGGREACVLPNGTALQPRGASHEMLPHRDAAARGTASAESAWA